MVRASLYVIPLLTLLVVSLIFFGLGAPRPVHFARIHGGATEGAQRLSWRVEVSTKTGSAIAPLPLAAVQVEARLSDGRSKTGRAITDETGQAGVLLTFGAPPVAGGVDVRVRLSGTLPELAGGQISLSTASWRARARTRGGWITPRSREGNGLTVRVAPGLGALALPFTTPLWIEVREGERPLGGARLALAPEGLAIETRRHSEELYTDQRGRLELLVQPREPIVALGITAQARDGRRTEFYSTLPVIAGALLASLSDRGLRVATSVPLERAYFAIQTKQAQWSGGALRLQADGRGGAVGWVEPGELPMAPWWIVVSTDPDLDSPATVGWPLAALDGSDPPQARAIPDRLLLDGLPQAEAAENDRRRKLFRLTAGVVITAALLTGLLVAKRVASAERALGAHLRQHLPEQVGIAPSRASSLSGLAIALVCLALAFLMMGFWVVLRAG